MGTEDCRQRTRNMGGDISGWSARQSNQMPVTTNETNRYNLHRPQPNTYLKSPIKKRNQQIMKTQEQIQNPIPRMKSVDPHRREEKASLR
uniref:Uncharacterized protein n=1 Tax=Zea mays TaxID=4577 RepID=B7ZZD0_MAIZE|nr:unknown [Zea mays]